VKRKIKKWLEKTFSNFPPYQAIVGGYRYYRATQEDFYKPEEFRHFGKRVRIDPGVHIAGAEGLYISDDVCISPTVQINAIGGCHLGRACQIAMGTIILTVDHSYTNGESLPYDSLRIIKPIYIEDYVWIGTQSIIGPGVRIGEGAIIGMGSVVMQDVPPLAIVSGNPAQVLMYRSKPDFERLKEQGAAIDPYKELPLLKIPPFMKRKYKNELKELGFDVSNGQEYFYYDKTRKPGERLFPADRKTESAKTAQ
jgi:acetyltransferase-like isoleucine patch superfamily enzyme